jgi:diaminopimelate decarboxylase
MLTDSFHYQHGYLHCDSVPVSAIIEQVGTPTYIYSLKRALANLDRIRRAFAELSPQIHYSAKANHNPDLLRTLVHAGAGIDCVSGGEIYRALAAGCAPSDIVFAGVGKTADELRYAVEQRVGWINVENVDELRMLNTLASERGESVRVAPRLNPGISARTHQYIATGHSSAKFGLSSDTVRSLLLRQADYPHLRFEGIHVHVGSQLEDTTATAQAVYQILDLIAPYPHINTVNIGGGFPVAYHADSALPDIDVFARALIPLLQFNEVILEPGRYIAADAGMLMARVLYIKEQAGQTFVILDAGMTDLMRPALYGAHHEIVPLAEPASGVPLSPAEVVGPVCETTDTLAHARLLPPLSPGDAVALLTAGAYGYAMASSYNARPRPAEVVVSSDGTSWSISRARETWADI